MLRSFSIFAAEKSRDTFLVLAVFAFASSVTIALFFYEKKRNDDFGQNQFDEETSIVESDLRRTFEAYAQVLRSGVSLYRATDRVDRQIWQNYISYLQLEKNYPGIQGVSFNAVLESEAELDAFEKMIQETDFPEFDVRPGGQQDLYTPIVYLEPFVGRNRPALGFDIYSETNRREAVDRAIATNEPSMTSKITLVQDDDSPDDGVKAGVLVILPIFEGEIDPSVPRSMQTSGLIISVFRIRDLMHTILGDNAKRSKAQRKTVSLFEITPEGEALDMYLSEPSDDHSPQFQSVRTFAMYGKTWRLVAESTLNFEYESRRNSHLTILLAGVLITLLLTATVASLVARSRDSRASADALSKSNQQISLLMKEINHRSKNLLSLIQAIARQTSAGSPTNFSDSFGKRLASLSASQDLLVKNKWQDIELSELLKSQLAHFSDLLGKRILLSGPKTFLDAANAQTMSMAIHELATNATKYGALSNDVGMVRINWYCNGMGPNMTFHFHWIESDGPQVTPPESKGFGSKVTGMMVQMSLEGEIERNFDPEGFSWHLVCPHRKLATKVAAITAGLAEK